MPEQETLRRAREDRQAGKSASTQAGEFVREEMHHIREGKHGARSTKQAIAIGLSKARRAGVHLGAPPVGIIATSRREASGTNQRAGTQARGSSKGRADTSAAPGGSLVTARLGVDSMANTAMSEC
jgi:hypothetical protein